MDGLRSFLDAASLAPHGFCLLWRPELIWLHVTSDSLIAAAYYSIPLALAVFVWLRRDLAFGWMFWLFAIFILACGTTHLFDIWTLWHPDYGTQGLVKAATAAASVITAAMLWPLLPKALALPSPAELRVANDRLTREISERGQAVDRLRDSESRFRRFYERTPVPLHSIGADGRIATVSEQWLELLGYRREEVVGRPLRAFLAEGSAELPPGDFRDVERRLVRRDGTVLDCLLSTHLERGGGGDPGHRLGVVVDVTARKRAEAALAAETAERQRAEAMLLQAQKMEAIGQLTGGIAHDFNNLLTVILGSLERLRRTQGEQRDLERATAACDRAAALTSQLLAFARREMLQPAPLDVNRLVRSLSTLLRRTLGEQITLETVQGGGLWPVFADPNRLENALLNLVLNARDAMPDGGRLTVETGNAHLDEAYAAQVGDLAPGQYVLIAVTDTGSGMSPEVAARVFEPFFTTKPAGRGTGLGLSQVYGFVKQSRGHIAVYSEPGQGTTMKIYLPRGDAAPAAEPAAAGPADLPRARPGEAVLLVEDSPDVLDHALTTLRELGYRVIAATDAAEALARLAEEPVTALLTDVGLPGPSGRQLAEAARQRRPGLPVLFMTGYARNAIVHNGMLDPGVQLLTKPFTAEGLARKLRETIDKGPG
ncbi:MAG: ATP-binding protein [Dongiaceae bacterium]